MDFIERTLCKFPCWFYICISSKLNQQNHSPCEFKTSFILWLSHLIFLLFLLPKYLKTKYKKSSKSIIKRTSSESRFYEMQSAAYRTDGYFRAMSAKNSISSNDNQISSCQAIRIALSTLYNLDDFHSDKIGEGFFSEVFKVSYKKNNWILP